MGQLSDYALEAILHRGPTGVVQAAVFRPTGHRVALERLASDLVATPGFTERLGACGRDAAGLRDAHLVPVYDLITEPDGVLLATGLPEPRFLRSACPAGHALQPAAALTVADDVIAALEAAHAARVVHGDVNAGMVSIGEGTARLGGFAVCLAVGTTPGVPSWRFPAHPSPERLDGAPPDTGSDLWAAAALLRELLTGTAEPGAPGIPPAVAEVLHHATSPSPADRFQDAGALRVALQAAARRELGPAWRAGGDLAAGAYRTGLRSRQSPAPTRAVQPAAAAAAAPLRSPPHSRRRGRGLLVALVVLAAVAGGATAAVLLARGTATPAGPLAAGGDVTVAVTPQDGGCNTTFQLRAQGSLTGTGTLRYSWDDGSGPEIHEVRVTADQGRFLFTRSIALSGTRSVDGAVTFQLVEPAQPGVVAHFRYRCT